ncbi:hypothetical protein OHB07_23370 [Streptomyces sp. NBC_00111]|uniref:hypothetical protein n=1 Tax=Streptomyces sp. NBC_00111 TaxID=2975655 RepID=UPI003252924C
MSENGAQEDRSAFEGRLDAAMKRTGEGFSAAGRPLVDGAVTRGRRRTVLRRSAVVTGSAMALAVIGLGGSFVTGGGGGGGSQGGGDGAAVGSQSTKVAGGDKGASESPYSAQEVTRVLEGLLPEGEVTRPKNPVTRGTGDKKELRAPFASVVYDDGHGKAAVSVGLSRQDPEAPPNEDDLSCPDKNLTPFEACSAKTLEDGSHLVLFQGWEYPDRRVETKRWYADLLTPEGYRITVSEWNAAAEKDAPVSRPTPPLSPEQLTALVRSEAWNPVAASLPAPVEQPLEQPIPQGQSGEEILAELTEQLPARLTVKDSGKQEGEYAYVVVDDGRGRSFVQINVQQGMSGVEGDLFGPDAEVLPDGTKVATRKDAGEKGGAGVKMWSADTMRPDGFRVVISAFNTGNQNEAASREDPALSIAELKKIATSGVWLR